MSHDRNQLSEPTAGTPGYCADHRMMRSANRAPGSGRGRQSQSVFGASAQHDSDTHAETAVALEPEDKRAKREEAVEDVGVHGSSLSSTSSDVQRAWVRV